MIYVYTTARGKLNVIEADSPQEAWQKACRKHSPQLMLDVNGLAYARATGGGCVRESDGDANAGHVAHLIAQAALPLSEPALRMLRDISAGRPATHSCHGRSEHGGANSVFHALRTRGLVTGRFAEDEVAVTLAGEIAAKEAA